VTDQSRLLARGNKLLDISNLNYARHTKACDLLAAKISSFEGQACFIVGGGPSLSDCKVTNLTGHVNSIGINKSFRKFKTTILYSNDVTFWEMLLRDDNMMRAYSSATPYRIFASPQVGNHSFHSDVAFIPRRGDTVVESDVRSGIYTGNNSGFAALMLAIALKANPIYLLGYDFYIDGDRGHFHEGYNVHYGYEGFNGPKMSERLPDFKKPFEESAVEIERLGYRVYNLNPKSELKCFKFLERDEVFELKRMS